MASASALVELFESLTAGCRNATAEMPWGTPGPIAWPIAPDERKRLIEAHLAGGGAKVLCAPQGRQPYAIELKGVVLGAYCPAADGSCSFIAYDLDGASGHADGLRDPAHAMRCLAERAEALGVADGLLAARSRSGQGRHVWLALETPIPLQDAVLLSAALATAAHRVASDDVRDADGERPHAFVCASERIAAPGESGSFELIPRSDARPQVGWAITLPAAGFYRPKGGGILVDPFSDRELQSPAYSRCQPGAVERVIADARRELLRRARPRHRPRPLRSGGPRLHPQTQELLAANVPPGSRNKTLFASTCNLLGVGVNPGQAVKLALEAAVKVGLPEREALCAIRSAARRKGVAL